MRIKKTSQTTPVQAEVVNIYSDSQENTYSCDYINNLYGITDGVPFKTGGKYQNKDVYRLIKNLGYLPSGALADRPIAIGISNFTPIIAPRIMYFSYLSNIQKWRYFTNPFLGSTNINSFIEDNNVLVTTGADRSNFQLVLDVTFIYND